MSRIHFGKRIEILCTALELNYCYHEAFSFSNQVYLLNNLKAWLLVCVDEIIDSFSAKYPSKKAQQVAMARRCACKLYINFKL